MLNNKFITPVMQFILSRIVSSAIAEQRYAWHSLLVNDF